MLSIKDILQLDEKDLESLVLTFDQNLAEKSSVNEFNDFVTRSFNPLKEFMVFKVKKVHLKPQGEDQITHPEVMIKLMDDSQQFMHEAMKYNLTRDGANVISQQLQNEVRESLNLIICQICLLIHDFERLHSFINKI